MSQTNSVAEIYGLVDPRGPWLRYIGKAKNPAKRLEGHLREAGTGRGRYPVHAWLRGMLADNLVPELVILFTCRTDNWKEMEIAAIQLAKERKHPVLNVALGGDEPFCPTDVRAENGRTNARAVHNDAFRKRIGSIKHQIGLNIRQGYCTTETFERLRLCASLAPHLFGDWANL